MCAVHMFSTVLLRVLTQLALTNHMHAGYTHACRVSGYMHAWRWPQLRHRFFRTVHPRKTTAAAPTRGRASNDYLLLSSRKLFIIIVCLIIIVSWLACHACVRTRVCLCCRVVLVYVIIPGAFDGGLPLIVVHRPREPSDVLVYFLSDEKAGGGFRDKNFFKETHCFCLTPPPTQSSKNTVYPQEFPNTVSLLQTHGIPYRHLVMF